MEVLPQLLKVILFTGRKPTKLANAKPVWQQ